MQVFIARNGSLHGQWTDEQVHALYRAGVLLPTDHYWVDGMPAWRTLASADGPSAGPKEQVPEPQEPLEQTTRLVPEDRPKNPSANPQAAAAGAAQVKATSQPPPLPVTKTPGSILPAPYVFSDPARRILQLLAPGGASGDRKLAPRAMADISKVQWLVPAGRTMPFGVAPIPSANLPAEQDKNDLSKPSTQAVKPPPLPKRDLPTTPAPGAAMERKKAFSSSFGPRARVGAWWLAPGLAILGFIAIYLGLVGSDRSPVEQALAQIQALKSGQILFDPEAADAQAQKLEEEAQDETGLQRKTTETYVELLHQHSNRLKACEQAKRPLLDLGVEPSKLISLKALDARRAAVMASQPPVQDMIDFEKNLETTARTLLAAKNVDHSDADAIVSDLNFKAKRPEQISYWQQESEVLADLLANLDLLKTNWGKWQLAADGKLTFDDPASLREYQGNEKKLQADLALQKSAQRDVLSP